MTPPNHTNQLQLDHNQLLFTSPNHASSSVLSCPSFSTIARDHTGCRFQLSPHHHHHQQDDDGLAGLNVGSRTVNQISTWSTICGQNSAFYKYKDPEIQDAVKRSMPESAASKTRSSMQKTTENSFAAATKSKVLSPTPASLQNHQHGRNDVNVRISSAHTMIRVCSDCNTTTTPLWRSGPRGPKSLCNACGIRQRKQRKVMAEASANGLAVPEETCATKYSKVQYAKEKKAQFKNKSRPAAAPLTTSSQEEQQPKFTFKDFSSWNWTSNNSNFYQAFPQDEVADAALLLMELSCGLVHF